MIAPAPEPAFRLAGGTATAIGSLPHTDPAAAVDLVLDRHPDLPAAPELPNIEIRPGVPADMVARWLVDVDGLDWSSGRLVAPADWSLTAEPTFDLDGPGHAGIGALLARAAGRSRPIKCSITGPVTLALALIEAGVGREAATEAGLAIAGAAARSVMDACRAADPELSVVLSIDDPGLTAIVHPRFRALRAHSTHVVGDSVAAARDAGAAAVAIHCCGATDWRIVTDAGPDIVSVPVGVLAVDDLTILASHINSGGFVAWGAVATDRPIGTTGARSWERLADMWCRTVRAGVDPVELRRRALITPACGLASHGVSQADRALTVTARLAERVRREVGAARFAVGA